MAPAFWGRHKNRVYRGKRGQVRRDAADTIAAGLLPAAGRLHVGWAGFGNTGAGFACHFICGRGQPSRIVFLKVLLAICMILVDSHYDIKRMMKMKKILSFFLAFSLTAALG